MLGCLSALLLTLLCFAACSDPKPVEPTETEDTRPPLVMTNEEAREILPPLVEGAYEINEIFFGRGLPYDGEPDGSLALVKAQYLPVSEDAGYTNVSQIKDAAALVYSGEYLKSIYPTMFDGITYDTEEDSQEGFFSEVSPRYKMIGGVLKTDAMYKAHELTTVPDPSQAEVSRCTPDEVFVRMPYTTSDGSGRSGFMTVSLVPQEDGSWRLDTPTY